MEKVIDLKIVRDLSKLRTINPSKFSEALSLIILDDFDAYSEITDGLFAYDEASGNSKTSLGYVALSEKIDVELKKSLISFVREV